MNNKSSKFVLRATMLAALSILLFLAPAVNARRPARPEPARGFDRSQIMLIKLKSGDGSTGQTLSQSARQASLMARKLNKALRQLEQAEKAYAKSRGRPDDRFLLSTAKRITRARETAQQLEMELDGAHDDLNKAVRNILLMEHNR